MSASPTSEAPAAAVAPGLRVLALSGGGFLGLYTAVVLEGLEQRAGVPLGRCFDLIAGTSIGAVLGLALAYEVPMSRLVRLFVDHGPEVFSNRALPSGALSRLVDLARSVAGPKYAGDALRHALKAEFGNLQLQNALHPIVVPAVDVLSCQTKIFKSPHVPASMGDGAVAAVDVAMAACAAPAYFPAVRIGERLYADGGLFAVAPDQVALHEAEHFMGLNPRKVRMLSIGTATSRYRPREGADDGNAGAVSWLSDGRLILTLISVQQQHVQAMMEDRLGPRYLRLDAEWPAQEGLGIDVATPAAAAVLSDLARGTLRQTPARLLAPFIGARSAAA